MKKATHEKKFRIVLTELELCWLRNLLAQQYHYDRRDIRYEKERIKNERPDSQIYLVNEQEKHLKQTAKLLRKLSRPLKIKWFIR